MQRFVVNMCMNVFIKKLEVNMSFYYHRLFEYAKRLGYNKTKIKDMAGLSSATMAKLSKNEKVDMDVLDRLCQALHCQIGDIAEHIPETHNSLLYRLREEMNMNLKGGIYHNTQIKLAYNSNHIEGSTLSEEQTRYIFETNTVGIEKEQDNAINVDDIVETLNHFEAFRYLLKVAEDELSEEIMKEFHRILKQGTSDARMDWFKVGDYKTRANTVGDKKTVAPAKVNAEIKKLLVDYSSKRDKDIYDLIDFHYHFECIHPFQDGNGRVGRLILFKECLKYGITPILIEDKHKMYYYRGLREYEQEKGYLVDTCLNGQDMYETLIKYFDV